MALMAPYGTFSHTNFKPALICEYDIAPLSRLLLFTPADAKSFIGIRHVTFGTHLQKMQIQLESALPHEFCTDTSQAWKLTNQVQGQLLI
jgi:hypothetical protein